MGAYIFYETLLVPLASMTITLNKTELRHFVGRAVRAAVSSACVWTRDKLDNLLQSMRNVCYARSKVGTGPPDERRRQSGRRTRSPVLSQSGNQEGTRQLGQMMDLENGNGNGTAIESITLAMKGQEERHRNWSKTNQPVAVAAAAAADTKSESEASCNDSDQVADCEETNPRNVGAEVEESIKVNRKTVCREFNKMLEETIKLPLVVHVKEMPTTATKGTTNSASLSDQKKERDNAEKQLSFNPITVDVK